MDGRGKRHSAARDNLREMYARSFSKKQAGLMPYDGGSGGDRRGSCEMAGKTATGPRFDGALPDEGKIFQVRPIVEPVYEQFAGQAKPNTTIRRARRTHILSRKSHEARRIDKTVERTRAGRQEIRVPRVSSFRLERRPHGICGGETREGADGPHGLVNEGVPFESGLISRAPRIENAQKNRSTAELAARTNTFSNTTT